MISNLMIFNILNHSNINKKKTIFCQITPTSYLKTVNMEEFRLFYTVSGQATQLTALVFVAVSSSNNMK